MAQFYKELKDRVKDNVVQVNRPSQLQPLITLVIRINDRQYERELEEKYLQLWQEGQIPKIS